MEIKQNLTIRLGAKEILERDGGDRIQRTLMMIHEDKKIFVPGFSHPTPGEYILHWSKFRELCHRRNPYCALDMLEKDNIKDVIADKASEEILLFVSSIIEDPDLSSLVNLLDGVFYEPEMVNFIIFDFSKLD